MQNLIILKKIRNHKGGFTLIELLVVISIIAVLSGLIMTFVFNARAEARDMSRQTDLEQIKLGLKLYKEAFGEYPDYPTATELGVGGLIDTELGRVLGELKRDPLAEARGGGEYAYFYSSNFTCNGESTVAVYALNVENEKYVNAEALCGLIGQNYHVAVVSGYTTNQSEGSGNNPTSDPGPQASNPVLGCTDASAQNFNSAATSDDGSCTYGGRSATGLTLTQCIPMPPGFKTCFYSDGGICIGFLWEPNCTP